MGWILDRVARGVWNAPDEFGTHYTNPSDAVGQNPYVLQIFSELLGRDFFLLPQAHERPENFFFVRTAADPCRFRYELIPQLWVAHQSIYGDFMRPTEHDPTIQ